MTERWTVGETEVARAFYAGRYTDVLARTIDSPAGGAADVDTAFAIGALSFVGRVVEAELLLETVKRDGSAEAARTVAAAGFFLAVAHCRAGDIARGRATIARAERESRPERDRWGRSLLLQGVACCHYFASDYRRAEQSTTHALRNAQAARFAYGQLLANDMRGHLLLRRGRFHEGLVVLGRAQKQALTLGLQSNAQAIAISLDVARASIASLPEGIAILEARLASERAEDGYSRRLILGELAPRLAWAGRSDAARDAVEQLEPLCAGDARAEVVLACARAHVARATEGWDAAEPHVARARERLPEDRDVTLEAEVAALALGLAEWRQDEAATAEAAAWLESLADDAGLYRARAWLAIHGRATGFTVADGDEATAARCAAAQGSVHAAIRAGMLGLLPELGGRAPGQRVHLFDDMLLVEDRGNLERLPGLSPRTREVLEAIARGEGTREALLAAVWGIRVYSPDRHDSVIKTSVSRLRSALGRAAAWVRTDAGEYALRDGVEVVRPGRLAPEPRRAAPAPAMPRAGKRAQRWRRALEALSRDPQASVAQLARRVGTSVRTMSRDLSQMHERSLVTRSGAGPATRYRAAPRISELMGDR